MQAVPVVAGELLFRQFGPGDVVPAIVGRQIDAVLFVVGRDAAWIVREDPTLRIVPDALWNAVKARQARQAAEIGARVKRGLSKRAAAATGRAPTHLYSGLLTCGQCGSKFTMSNKRIYGCGSWINGKACSNRIYVRRELVEHLLLAQVKDDLSDPAIVEHVTREVRRRLKVGRPKVDRGRLRELEREVDNLVNAIATGALRNSPALAARLTAAESELARLKEPPPDKAPIERLIPRIGERYLAMVRELNQTAERDPVRARQALIEALEEPITLHPENGRGRDQLQNTAAACEQRVGKFGSGGRI